MTHSVAPTRSRHLGCGSCSLSAPVRGSGRWRSRSYSLRIPGKGGKTRLVPLDVDLADMLLAKQGYAFPGKIDGHLSPAYVSRVVSKVLPDGVTAHKLRHRFATRAYRGSNSNLRAVQELLGHSSIATTQVYVSVDADELRQAALSARAEWDLIA
jgi:integrase